ncbi:hypothetical protein E1200_14880 [Actinomadura sp. GC306]|uniref:Acg family FMN-binding oxidoreductase n=1 Tax=Actinomadura sp. GC306 TaxID=2530367 RepID=UPI001052DD6C|nr:hypothetical protein [Actinomadura sp. GC306]TDC67477.1 hypothetical protein E1200_14880 [Actinomadura sp. GC306]
MIEAKQFAAKPRETSERPDLAARFVVRAAIQAPSIHNTQPWRFIDRPAGLELWADRARLLPITDNAGREMAISCGAALFNARLAVRRLGFTARVRLLPDPAHPDLLARITWGTRTAARPYEERLYRAISHRHTHRGPFLSTPLPAMLPAVLAGIARHEGADLRLISGTDQLRRLAEHVQAAEAIQLADARIADELLDWAIPPHSRRRDGLAPDSFPALPDGLEFPSREFFAPTPRALRHHGPQAGNLGTVALLTTREDRRVDWLQAGQALQHVLLHATTVHVSAAFHTQPLELPYLRAAVRRDLVSGHPQMVLRLGHAPRTARTRRRPVTNVLLGE